MVVVVSSSAVVGVVVWILADFFLGFFILVDGSDAIVIDAAPAALSVELLLRLPLVRLLLLLVFDVGIVGDDGGYGGCS